MTSDLIRKRLLQDAKDRGLTNYRLAKITGSNETSVGRWHEGTGWPTVDNWIMYCTHFNLSLDEMAGLKPVKRTHSVTKRDIDKIVDAARLLGKKLNL